MIAAAGQRAFLTLRRPSLRTAMDAIVILGVASFVAATALVAIRRYESYMAFGDLTVFDQFFWNTMHGRPFQSTYPWSVHAFWPLLTGVVETVPADASYLGLHFEPGLLVLLPLYALVPSPTTLVALQAAFCGLAAIPIYLFARDRLASPQLGAAVAVAYLLHPALSGLVLNDFHAQGLVVLWASLAIWLVSIRRWYLVVWTCVICLLTTEVAAVFVTMLGLYIAAIARRRVLGLALAGTAVAYFAVVTGLVLPELSLTGRYVLAGHFSRWGGNPVAIALAMATQPTEVWRVTTQPAQLQYLFGLLAPTMFLALLAPAVIAIALPVVVANLLADSPSLRILLGQYNAMILPPLYFAMAAGLRELTSRLGSRRGWLAPGGSVFSAAAAVAIVAVSLVSNGRLSYFPVAESFRSSSFTYPANVDVLDRLIRQLPSEASVSTVDNLSTHLSRHHELHLFPVFARQADYVILPTTEGRIWPLTLAQLNTYLDELRRSPEHQLIAEEGGYILIQRRPPN